MAVKMYRLYCEVCGYKRTTDGSDIQDLYEIKVSPVPGGLPAINPQTKNVDVRPSKKPTRKFRCPSCGRVLIPRKVQPAALTELPPDKKETVVDEPLGIQLEVKREGEQ